MMVCRPKTAGQHCYTRGMGQGMYRRAGEGVDCDRSSRRAQFFESGCLNLTMNPTRRASNDRLNTTFSF